MFTRAGKLNFLRGQDDFFQTANQPVSVRHVPQPYNKINYFMYDVQFTTSKKSPIMSNTTLFNSPCFMLKVDAALIQVLGRRLPHHQQHEQNSLRFPDDMAYPRASGSLRTVTKLIVSCST